MLKKGSTQFLKERDIWLFCVCVYVCKHLSEHVKERQRESQNGSTWFLKERERYLTVLCVWVWAFVWACKRETEREQKRINLIFKREREKKRKKTFNSIFNKREKKNLFPYIEKTYFLTLWKLFPCKHKYPTDGTALEHIKLF
jgi:hypothetical protein